MTVPASTAARRLVTGYWIANWSLCPAGVPEQVDFDPGQAADVAPWTTDQVRQSVGYVLLRFSELDRWGGPLAGEVGGKQYHHTFTLDMLQFEISTPSGVDAALAEGYAARIEDLFAGVTLRLDDPQVVVRQLSSQYPIRRRGGGDDGSFRRALVEVQVERRERTPLAGQQEA